MELSNDNCNPKPGRVTNNHSTIDKYFILYSYLREKNKARLTFNRYMYMNHMFDKWNELRPDKPLSKSALANLEILTRLNPESIVEKR